LKYKTYMRAFYLYLAGGTVALALFIYELVVYHASLSVTDITLSAMPVVILYYLAFKVFRENRDEDLM
jgi:hypothetical protein